MKTKTLSLIAAAVAAATFASSSAFAAPSELYFSQSAGWVNPQTDASLATGFFATPPWSFGVTNPTAGAPEYPANTYGTMQWYNPQTPANISSISITSYNSTSSDSAFGAGGLGFNSGNGDNKWEQGEFWVIDNLHQVNDRLPTSGVTPPSVTWTADTLANLRIFDTPPLTAGNEYFADLNSSTRISFSETSNVSGCVNVAGTNPCNDIYRVLQAEFAPLSFSYGSQTIFIDFMLVPGPGTVVCTSSSDPGCANATGIGPGEIWVYTPENSTGFSDIYVAMAWRVPEPSMVALFGMGLLGLGLTARRRSKKAIV